MDVNQPNINWDSPCLPDEWKRFEQHARLMFAGPLSGKTEKIMCAYLLIWIGDKGREIFNTFTFIESEKDKLEPYLTKFKDYATPKTNSVFARYVFQKRDQHDGESVESYITEVKTLVKACSYRDADEMVRDRIVCGILNPRIRERLLVEGDALTLETAIEKCRMFETTQAQLKTFDERNIKKEVDSIHRINHRPSRRRDETTSPRSKECYFCGGSYTPNHACPAKGKTCTKCRKPNHFARVCRSSKDVNVVSGTSNTHDNSDDEDEIFLHEVSETNNKEEAIVSLTINSQLPVSFKVDTGAQANILPAKLFEMLSPKPEITKAKQKLTSYCGGRIPVRGTCTVSCSYEHSKPSNLQFYIVETDSVPIIGFKSSLDLNLIKLIMNVNRTASTDKPTHNSVSEIIKEYNDVFEGLGKLEGECHFYLKDGAIPKVHPVRKIPSALREKLKTELDRMEKDGVIEKVTVPTEWVNSMVAVQKKDGSLRLCIDPVDLNKSIRRPHYPIPTLEDSTSNLHGAKYFTKLDARSGYWSLSLDEESSDLTTFNTIFGRYRFKRMPFGIISAQDEFQRRIEEAFEGLDGFIVIIDDLLVFGSTLEEHNRRLVAVLKRARTKGVRFNLSKCKFGMREVTYFGHMIGENGMRPDPEKLRAISAMPKPVNKEELATLLGMLNYLARYIPNLSTKCKDLRDLCKDNEFVWETKHDTALKEIKGSMVLHLRFFDHRSTSIDLTVDASSHGLGAYISTNGQAIAYASRALTPTEQRYSQLEKELYAIVFGCRYFHHYIYGRQVNVFTDHRPLETILRQPLHKAPARLQRMMLQIQPYDLSFTYQPGAEIPVADALSRLHLSDVDESTQRELEAYVHQVVKLLPVSDSKLQEICNQSKEDPQLVTLRQIIETGWPSCRKLCPSHVLPFWGVRHELSINDDIIFKGDRIVVPTSMRSDTLKQLHAPHLGVEKTKQRARMLIYWPRLNTDIENLIASCYTCRKHSKSLQKEPLICSPVSVLPWQQVACDIFSWHGANYLLVVDYHSRFFEIDLLRDMTSAEIILKLKSHFARHGIPQVMMSDNGSQFVSQEFKRFARDWGFDLKTSSPNYPQSNGLVEKTIQTCKSIMTKASENGSDPYLGILEYRNTPVDGLAAPSQMLMSRQLRSKLPCTVKHLEKKVVQTPEFLASREMAQHRQKSYHDRHARAHPELREGDQVFFRKQPEAPWKSGEIIRKANEPRSYYLSTEDGSILRRNRRHLVKAASSSTPDVRPAVDYPTRALSRPPNPSQDIDCPDTSASMSPHRSSQRDRTIAIEPGTAVAEPRLPEGEPPSTIPVQATAAQTTRSGRAVKPPVRLNL